MTPAELRTLRESLGWSQSRLAGALGRSLRQVAYYESGDYTIPPAVERAMVGPSLASGDSFALALDLVAYLGRHGCASAEALETYAGLPWPRVRRLLAQTQGYLGVETEEQDGRWQVTDWGALDRERLLALYSEAEC